MLFMCLTLFLITKCSAVTNITVTPENFQEGNSVTLTCSSASNTAPQATDRWRWFKEDVDLNEPQQTYVISNFKFSVHSGVYKCVFDDRAGTIEFSRPHPLCRDGSQAHCLGGPDCITGLCPQKCAYGYIEPPKCQDQCPTNKYGLDCAMTCHCLSNQEVCDIQQGVCPSHQCHQDWEGSGCSQRLPKLHGPPSLLTSTCSSLTVSWNAWDPDQDFGDFPSIAAYRLLTLTEQNPSGLWVVVDTQEHNDLTTAYSTVVPLNTATRSITHQFRVDVYYNASGKMAFRASPGFPSVPVYPCDVPASLHADTQSQVQTGRTVTELRHMTLNMEEVKVSWTLASSVVAQLPADVRMQYQYVRLRQGLCPMVQDAPVRTDLAARSRGLLLHHLLPGYQYEYTFSISSATVPTISEVLNGTFSTKPAAPRTPIEDVTTFKVSAFSATLSWTDAPCSVRGGSVSHYEVEVSSPGLQTNITLSDTPGANLTGLRPSTTFQVSVRYVNDIAPGPFSIPITFETDIDMPPPPAPPVRLRQTWRDTHCVGLAWETGTGSEQDVTGYEIYDLTDGATLDPTPSWFAPADVRTTRVCLLQPARRYVLGMAARGNSSASAIVAVVVFTDQCSPPAPAPPVVHMTTLSSVILKIRPVVSPNVTITDYLIYVAEAPVNEQEKVDAGIATGPTGHVPGEEEHANKGHLENSPKADVPSDSNPPAGGITPEEREARYTDRVPSRLPETSAISIMHDLTGPSSETPTSAGPLAKGQQRKRIGGSAHVVSTATSVQTKSLEMSSRSNRGSSDLAMKQGEFGSWSEWEASIHLSEYGLPLGRNIVTAHHQHLPPSPALLSFALRTRVGGEPRSQPGSRKRAKGLRSRTKADNALAKVAAAIQTPGLAGRTVEDTVHAAAYHLGENAGEQTAVAWKARSGSPPDPRLRGQDRHLFLGVTGTMTQGDARRSRRQVKERWDKGKPPGHVYVKESPEDLLDETLVVVGDGDRRNGVYNRPLDPRGRYHIYLVSCSQWEGATRCAASEPVAVSMPREPLAAGMARDRRLANIVTVCVFCCLAFLLAVLALAVRLMGWGWVSSRYTPGFQSPALSKSCLASESQMLVEGIERHWSRTFQLGEKRHIVTGRDLLPLDQVIGVAADSDTDVTNGVASESRVTLREEFDSLPGYSATGPGYHGIFVSHKPPALFCDWSNHSSCTTWGNNINANFITGYDDPQAPAKSYIAARSPGCADDALEFWRLIYQEHVTTAVLLSSVVEDGSIRCFQYWPDVAPVYHGPFRIRQVDLSASCADFAEHLLAVDVQHDGDWRGAGSKTSEERLVRLFVFTSWYDALLCHDPYPLLELHRRVEVSREPHDKVTLVHCDSGCGRTAVFIALDILAAAYAKEGEVSVFRVVSGMRRERPYMVHTFTQYVLIYIALFEDKHAGNTYLNIDLPTFYHDLLRKSLRTRRPCLFDQFQILSQVTACTDACRRAKVSRLGFAQHNATGVVTSSSLATTTMATTTTTDGLPTPSRVAFKDSRVLTVPTHLATGDATSWRPTLGRGAGEAETGGGVMVVVVVNGYKRHKQFLLAPLPSADWLEDNWRLIYSHDVRSVLLLDDADAAERPLYCPGAGSRSMRHVGPFSVQLLDTSETSSAVTVYSLCLTRLESPHVGARSVRVYHCRMWPDKRAAWECNVDVGEGRRARDPSIPMARFYGSLLQVLEQVIAWQQEATLDSSPLLLHCSDGFSRSGLVAAAAQVIWRADEEDRVSVYRMVRRLKICCPPAVAHYMQYRFLHRLLWGFQKPDYDEEGTKPCSSVEIHEEMSLETDVDQGISTRVHPMASKCITPEQRCSAVDKKEGHPEAESSL